MSKRPPNRRELAQMIIAEPDGPQRTQYEQWYWTLVAEECGEQRTSNWRWEYQWLRDHQ